MRAKDLKNGVPADWTIHYEDLVFSGSLSDEVFYFSFETPDGEFSDSYEFVADEDNIPKSRVLAIIVRSHFIDNDYPDWVNDVLKSFANEID